MSEHDPQSELVPIPDFWQTRLEMNASVAIYYQWEQLEKTGCIDDFRIAAGLKDAFREGYFFADSDAYKWLDAASRIYASTHDPRLEALMDGFIWILEKAQMEDGYLYTFNQVHFPGCRWDTLQIGHEFYCVGHLVEAGIAHHEATGEESLLRVALRTADLLVERFMQAPPLCTDGHEEIEIALVRLSRHTGKPVYHDLARRLMERRGNIRFFPYHFITQFLRVSGRMKTVAALRKQYYRAHPEAPVPSLPAHNRHKVPLFTPLRFLVSALSGKYTQQNAPLREQVRPEGHMVPEGHAVRFTYLNTASAMLTRDEQDDGLVEHLAHVWEHMTSRRMYVTGGIGSLPLIEGFGRDYELDPAIAYAETCAALGSMQWNREMSCISGDAKYEDLFEWQLYNAASVGIGQDGKTYFYNNPLICRGGLKREGWYDIPCCPSNLSRTWASLPGTALSTDGDKVTLKQFITGKYTIATGVRIELKSGLPWSGKVSLTFTLNQPRELDMRIRVPAWAGECEISLNGKECTFDKISRTAGIRESAVGLHFENAYYARVSHEFCDGDRLEVRFSMPVLPRRQDERIKGSGGMVALTRGPLVFCLENVDNTADIFSAIVDPQSITSRFDSDLLGGVTLLEGVSPRGEHYKWIPYMLWGNRGESKMTAFCKTT